MAIDHILEASAGKPLTHRAYMLATADHETGGTFEPVREAFGKTDQDTINRLDRAWAKGKLPQVSVPYWRPDDGGKAWFGRGFIQLTHKANYIRASRMLGVDLLGNPSLAMNPDIAATILVRGMSEGWFTEKRLSDFHSYVDMRKVVNGTDRADKIARLAVSYEKRLRDGLKPQSPWAALIRALWAFIEALLRRLRR